MVVLLAGESGNRSHADSQHDSRHQRTAGNARDGAHMLPGPPRRRYQKRAADPTSPI
jgi:hypothetical protein